MFLIIFRYCWKIILSKNNARNKFLEQEGNRFGNSEHFYDDEDEENGSEAKKTASEEASCSQVS